MSRIGEVATAGATGAPTTVAPTTVAQATGAPARVVLDPTSENRPAARAWSPRLDSVAGRRVGLLDISKPRGDVFLDRMAELLAERGAVVSRYSKPTFTKPAPVDVRQEIAANCEAVIEALAD